LVCLDTNFLVALLRGESDAIKRAEEIDSEGLRKVTTPINAFELYLGAHLSERKDGNVRLVRDLLLSIGLLEFDERSCDMAGAIAADLAKLGRPIGTRDSMIAGIALRFEQTLLTRNTEHFSRVKGLKVRAW